MKKVSSWKNILYLKGCLECTETLREMLILRANGDSFPGSIFRCGLLKTAFPTNVPVGRASVPPR